MLIKISDEFYIEHTEIVAITTVVDIPGHENGLYIEKPGLRRDFVAFRNLNLEMIKEEISRISSEVNEASRQEATVRQERREG